MRDVEQSLKKPDYIEHQGGIVSRVFCKMCGSTIAGMSQRPAGSGSQINRMVTRFKRFSSYAEAKFKCNDGSFHVTNGCKACLTGLSDLETMTALLAADMTEQGRLDKRKVTEFIAVDLTGSGIV